MMVSTISVSSDAEETRLTLDLSLPDGKKAIAVGFRHEGDTRALSAETVHAGLTQLADELGHALGRGNGPDIAQMLKLLAAAKPTGVTEA